VQVAAREQQALMLEAIASLPELYREPFVLKHAEGMSYRQIGELLGLPPDTVETRLVRARRLLREKLAGKV
jgi:RNA polymerase sigma-70 factor (ECF subfamily)